MFRKTAYIGLILASLYGCNMPPAKQGKIVSKNEVVADSYLCERVIQAPAPAEVPDLRNARGRTSTTVPPLNFNSVRSSVSNKDDSEWDLHCKSKLGNYVLILDHDGEKTSVSVLKRIFEQYSVGDSFSCATESCKKKLIIFFIFRIIFSPH